MAYLLLNGWDNFDETFYMMLGGRAKVYKRLGCAGSIPGFGNFLPEKVNMQAAQPPAPRVDAVKLLVYYIIEG